MNKKIIQKIVLAGAIIKNNKILIVQRHKDENIFPNMWELPSGKREFLEPSEHSLLREIKEETGIDVEIIMPFSVFDYEIEKENEIKDSTQITFLVKPTNSFEVKLSSEHQDFRWIDKNKINDYNLTEKTKNVIKDAFNTAYLLNIK